MKFSILVYLTDVLVEIAVLPAGNPCLIKHPCCLIAVDLCLATAVPFARLVIV